MSYTYDQNDGSGMLPTALITIGSIVLLFLLFWGLPKWNVWRQTLSGEAELRKQEYSKQVLVEQAKAEKESATLYADAEVERAKGVAAANEIIGDSLKGNESYLRYLMIQTLEDQDTQLIYIPTEAGLPILEAGRNN